MKLTRWQDIKGPLVVASVATAIVFFALTSQIFVIWPYLKPADTRSVLILVLLNFCILNVLVNYFLTCTVDPGSVPNRWIPRQQAFIEVKKSTHAPRFCKTCNNYKPPRSHHCSKCNRCVLKMDHHCPWVNNCIGFNNYCHFFRFLIYVDISCIGLFTLLCCRLAQVVANMHHYDIRPTAIEACFLSINLICTAAIMVAVGILAGYHIYCITTNTTTIEGWEKGRSLTIKGMGKVHNIKCPYNQGIYRNLQSVLGRWPIFWLLPGKMIGTGLDFPISTRYTYDEELDTQSITTIASSHIANEKHFSSSIPLRRENSVESNWTSTTELNQAPAETKCSDHHYNRASIKQRDIMPLTLLRTKESTNTLGGRSVTSPATPASVLTFASTATTLVDLKSPTKSNSQYDETYSSQNYHR